MDTQLTIKDQVRYAIASGKDLKQTIKAVNAKRTTVKYYWYSLSKVSSALDAGVKPLVSTPIPIGLTKRSLIGKVMDTDELVPSQKKVFVQFIAEHL